MSLKMSFTELSSINNNSVKLHIKTPVTLWLKKATYFKNLPMKKIIWEI